MPINFSTDYFVFDAYSFYMLKVLILEPRAGKWLKQDVEEWADKIRLGRLNPNEGPFWDKYLITINIEDGTALKG